MQFIDSDKDMSDTYYLARLIEERSADSFAKMVDVFSELEKKKISLGVIVIYDMLANKFLCISDGARSLYIDFSDDEQNKYNYFSSISDSGDDEYSFYGYFIWDMKWNVIQSEFKFVNYHKPAPVVPVQPKLPAPNPYYGWDRDDGYDYPPSRGEGKSSKAIGNGVKGVTSLTKGYKSLKEEKENYWKENKTSEISDEKINIFNKKREEEYSDDIVLFVEWLMENTITTNVASEFYLLYADGVQRALQWINDGEIHKHIVDTLNEYFVVINDEYEQLRWEWLEWFWDKWSSKYLNDLSIIDSYIDDKIEILVTHIDRLT